MISRRAEYDTQQADDTAGGADGGGRNKGYNGGHGVGRAGALLISLVFLGSILATFIGNSEALRQTSFLVPSSNTNAIVIRSFGDKLICVEINPKTKIPTKTFFLLSVGSDNNLQLNLKDIGPLNFN